MFGKFKKLLRRIKSLEEHIGVVYDDDTMFGYHEATQHGQYAKVDKLVRKEEKKSK